jgi:uncharacterized protein (UPF0548 family)
MNRELMLHWSKPDAEAVAGFVAAQAECGFTYDAVGATNGTPPDGYRCERSRVRLGTGDAVFRRAKDALLGWRQFGLGWVELQPADAPPVPGRVVAVLGRACGFWTLNACRVVSVVDEAGPPARFGYAYGTLPRHAGTGEERFLVEQDADGVVWYEIFVFSRPWHWLAKVGYPFFRLKQKQFKRRSGEVMQRLVVER